MGASRNGQVEYGERGTAELDDTYYSGTIEPRRGEPLAARRPIARDFTRMIERDGMAQALDYAITLPIRMGLPYVEPHPQDKGEAELIRTNLFASAEEGGMTTPIQDVIAQMSTGVTHRFAPFEKVFRDWEGQTLIKKLAFRPQAKITIRKDRNGSFNGYIEKGFRDKGKGHPEPYEEEFDPDKVFVYFHGGNRKPNVGESALEAAYRHHIEKINILKLTNEYLQSESLGILVGTHGPRASANKRRGFFDALKNIRGGGRIIKSPDEDIQRLSAGGSGEAFRAERSYQDAQMALSCLVQFLLLSLSSGPTGTGIGSNALSRDHSDFFTMSEESRRDEMALSLTNHVAAQVISINFLSPKYPRIRYTPLSDTERARALDVWKQLITASVRRVSQIEFDAIQERALQAIGIDPEKLKEEAGAEEDDTVEDDNPPVPEDTQRSEAWRRSMDALRNRAGAGGDEG